MATLKSIKNKYLSASDGDVLGVTTNTENVAALSFKLATADSLTKFNMVDGFTDDYNDATGVDASGSTDETRNSENYYSGSASGTISAITATGAGTWTAPHTGNAEILVVAGGGGGSNGYYAGGAGGGGIVHATAYPVTASVVYDVSVGAGGAGGNGVAGSNSVFNVNGEGANTTVLTANGGGRGGGGGGPAPGGAGGSGGGADNDATPGGATNQPTSFGTPQIAIGYGNAGGNSNSDAGAGGGGAGGAGGNSPGPGSATPGGVGGSGKEFTTFGGYGTDTSNSTSPASGKGYFGGGGGGGAYDSPGQPNAVGGVQGVGGGGYGEGRLPAGGSVVAATSGQANTGGGGGGGDNGSGKPGGSGIVLIKSPDIYNNMTLQSNVFTAQAAPTTTRIILDEWAYKGAQTLNTDIKAYASRDNGTTFTQVTLADQGFLLGAGGINGNTQGMLHMDGTDGGTTFTDSCTEGGNTAKVWTASGNAHTSTDQFKFGTASAQFDGTGDYINTPATSDWDFGSDNFTIDFWMRPGVVNSQQRLFGNLNSGGSSSQFEFILDGSNNMNFSGSLPSGLAVANGATLAVNTWYHIALTRSGDDWRLFVNGTAGTTADFSGTMGANTTTSIGRSGAYTSQLYTGFIDEVRITTGVALWTSNFTSPVEPYQTSRRLLSGSVDISGQPAGTNMKYKVTTHNQALTKQTRVYGTSMAWA